MNTLNHDQKRRERPFHKISPNGMLYGQGKVISLHNPSNLEALKTGVKRGLYNDSDLVGITIDEKV